MSIDNFNLHSIAQFAQEHFSQLITRKDHLITVITAFDFIRKCRKQMYFLFSNLPSIEDVDFIYLIGR